MGIIRDIERLDPSFKMKVKVFLNELDKAGILYVIIETLRLPITQRVYYNQGRLPLDAVNEGRKAIGLWAITAKENEKRITNTLSSKHIIGKAIDIAPGDKNGKPWWNAPDEYWLAIAKISAKCGLEPGYFWPEFKDAPHHQESI